jgi:hypothetical protein
MRRLVLQLAALALLTLVASFAAPREAAACSCFPANLTENYNWHSDVMRVRVLGHRTYRDTVAHIAVVQETYKGCTQREDFVILVSPESSAACGVVLERGSWLVTADERRPGVFEIGSCGYNRPWRTVPAEEREFLDTRYNCCDGVCGCVDAPEVLCFADPCSVTSCPEGECVANYCGGCNAEFYTEGGQAVCTACSGDEDCGFNQVCTRDGCRTRCESDEECRGGFCGDDHACHERSALQLYYTCGEPVCRGYTPTDDLPTCPRDLEPGGACRDAGSACAVPDDPCNRRIVCAAEDPRSHGCPISTRDVKRDVEYLGADELAALTSEVLGLRLASYNYVFEPEGAEPQLGFIIEDIEPSAAVDEERDMVDLYGYLSMTVAAIQTQAAQIEALRAEVESLRAEREGAALPLCGQ